ncbi:PREDICTED: exostosin-like 1 isoform X2 [Chinchilla lanigera]|uniref:exostosin-like 1 isoform X2 n=1 Tax=Chinchilla lanigera TaxID=34839 RepID=UPI0006963457|nr:PREDICTED: exostosin-like 1 isoform X2 [Chinchilla lanigera]
MQFWRRKSLWLALSASWLLLTFLGVLPLLRLAVSPRPQPIAPQGWPCWLDAALLRSFSQPEEPPEDAPQLPQAPRGASCSWGICFDPSRCRGDGLKVFAPAAAGPASEMHRRILASLESSRYHTRNLTEACLLLLLSADTPSGRCGPAPHHWDGGRNHLVVRLHPDPCPWASQLGQAMVAEASPRVDTFRPGFDVALPLLPEAHPLRGGAPGQLRQHSPHPRATLLALAEEGGRWRTADTHSSTCPWDGRCEQDLGSKQTSPEEKLPNATFCLIPGRHAEASRFLQALQAGCIPVLLSPRWELPFSEVIDWTKAAIVADERLPLQVLAALQEMAPARVLALRQQTQFLWDAYFSSVEKVVHTTLEILQDRILGVSARPSLQWNSPPGALLALSTFSRRPQDFPFYHLQQGSRPEGRFSALIWVGAPGQPPLKLIQAVAGSQHCAQLFSGSDPGHAKKKQDEILPQDSDSVGVSWHPGCQITFQGSQILVLWSGEKPLPFRWPDTRVPLTVVDGHRKVSDRFFPYSAISTDAILSLDAHSSLSTSEVDFAFVVWQSFPERMVGFLTWSHFWDAAQGGWGYTAETANEFSMVLTAAAFYHRYYHTLFTYSLPKAMRTLADEAPACVDVLMNFLVAAVTKLPPIKVPYGKQHQEAAPLAPRVPGSGPQPQPPHQDCINQMAAEFGHMPLVSSRLRLDPVLFKDPVSVQRKKYRSLEKP